MPIGGTCTERTIQATDFSDHRFWRKSSELCFRLGGEILRVLYDVINDVTNDVIFYLKKLILKPFLHIKGSKYESSRYDIYERASSGLSKNRGPSYGARKVVDFRHFQPKSGERITDEAYTLAIYPTTNVFIWTGIVH